MLEQRLNIHAEPTARDVAILDQFLGHSPGQVAGDGAAQAEADFVDADDFALAGSPAARRSCRRKSPRHARTSGRASRHSRRPAATGSPEQARHDHLGIADDAERDGLGEGHRAAHGQDRIADASLSTNRRRWRSRNVAWFVRAELDHGDIRQRVGADQFGLDFLAVREGANDAGGMPGHVMVGDQKTVLGDDGAAADGLLLDFAPIAEVGGNHLDPHQGGADMCDGGIHLRWRARGRRATGGGTGHSQGRAAIPAARGFSTDRHVDSRIVRPFCRANPCSCKPEAGRPHRRTCASLERTEWNTHAARSRSNSGAFYGSVDGKEDAKETGPYVESFEQRLAAPAGQPAWVLPLRRARVSALPSRVSPPSSVKNLALHQHRPHRQTRFQTGRGRGGGGGPPALDAAVFREIPAAGWSSWTAITPPDFPPAPPARGASVSKALPPRWPGRTARCWEQHLGRDAADRGQRLRPR